ncbi:small nuclear RNA activating complex (SNAPc), subunit SNAP43 [Ceratobasidium sp. AG-Ba]|nr:small nuclear RNA activating complex (SNAPc), subunit SNAP43 [Ceratobasidium sp. AG-Ba]
MTLRPTVALHGSLPALQPEFYYSDVFLTPLRLDVDKLLTDFVQRLLNKPDQDGLPASSSPTDLTGASAEQNSFEIFKTCWVSNHWRFMHLRCLDAIGRGAFLHVLHRLFLAVRQNVLTGSLIPEAALSYQETYMKLGALYGLYTFYVTQPAQLYRLKQIPIPLDHIQQLFQLPLNFEYPHNLVATHLIATLISNKAFRVLPISGLHPLNPTVLPQTFVAISTTDQDTRPRGPGRVTLTQRLRTAKRAVDELRALLDRDDPHMASQDIAPPPSSVNYTHLRSLMLKAAGPENVADAIRETSQTLEKAEVVLAQEGVAVEVDSEIRGGRLLDLVHEIRE